MRSGFFNSEITGWDGQGLPEFDRAESADFFAEFFNTFFKNGVFNDPADSMQVIEKSGGGMTVNIKPGKALINGYFAWESDIRTIQFEASETLDRIDRVVLRLNLATRKIDYAINKGVAATTPSAPALNRPASGQSGDLYELCLANVFISKNSTSIVQSKITDTRLDSAVCGISIYAYGNPNLNSIFNQYQAALNQYMDVVRAALSDTLYGQLQTMIDAVDTKVTSATNTINRTKIKHTGAVQVPLTLWQAYSYASYGERYKFVARVPVAGMTGSHYVNVIFHDRPWENENIANLVFSSAGVVEILSKTKPSGSIEIRDIYYWEVQ